MTLEIYSLTSFGYQATSNSTGQICWVRQRADGLWETAEPSTSADRANWGVCPVAGASHTRADAVYAHRYYFPETDET